MPRHPGFRAARSFRATTRERHSPLVAWKQRSGIRGRLVRGTRIAVDLSRDKPIGILTLLCVVTGAIVIVTAFNRPQCTRAGDALLRELQERHARLARAPRDAELALAVALVGTTALAGSAFDAYHQARQGSGSGDSGSSSDGDGGGSGCGGCGGD